MKRARIVYQDWIVQLGHDPDLFPENPRDNAEGETEGISSFASASHVSEEIEQAVASGMQALTEDEREFIARFHFMGESYQEIAERSGRIPHKLEALHRRALRKLKLALTEFASKRYQLMLDDSRERSRNCAICQSNSRQEINHLINQKHPHETWRPIIRQLREQYGISIRSPQVLIGHQKYHGMQSAERTMYGIDHDQN
jgi:hypothetical protein